MTSPAPESWHPTAILARAERAAQRLELAEAGQLDLDLEDAARVIEGVRVLRRNVPDLTPPTVQYGERAR